MVAQTVGITHQKFNICVNFRVRVESRQDLIVMKRIQMILCNGQNCNPKISIEKDKLTEI